MDLPPPEITKSIGQLHPLTNTEVDELANGSRRLAFEGIALPKHLLRHAYVPQLNELRHYGSTLDALPEALDRLEDRETVVVGLLRRFEQAVRDHHNQVKNRKPNEPLDRNITQRYFDVCFLLPAAKPKTEEAALQVAEFLSSELDEVIAHAAEMLEGTAFSAKVVNKLFEGIANQGIREWPNRKARALASFADVPEVRERLLTCLHAEGDNARHGAVLAFTYLRERAGEQAVNKLFAIAGNDDDPLQAEALDGLRQIVPHDPKLRQQALRLIGSDKFWVRGHAIPCLEKFSDRESTDALLKSLLDEGGHDFDNAGSAAKLLAKRHLSAKHVLKPLMTVLETLLEREDSDYRQYADFRTGVQTLATAFKEAAEKQGTSTERLGIVHYSSPDSLASILPIFANLGADARPALPLLHRLLERPYITGSEDETRFRDMIQQIEGA